MRVKTDEECEIRERLSKCKKEIDGQKFQIFKQKESLEKVLEISKQVLVGQNGGKGLKLMTQLSRHDTFFSLE